jgi:hypothetical protein
MLRWTLGILDIDDSLGTLKFDRRSPAPWTILRACAFRHILEMPLQCVLPRKPITATTALPRRWLVREDALVPLQVTHSLAHLLAAGDVAREARCTGARDRGSFCGCTPFLRGRRAATAASRAPGVSD